MAWPVRSQPMWAQKPPSLGRVRVAFLVRVLVMHAVDGDPEDGAAFEGQRAAHGEQILHPLRRFVAAVGQQAVVSHADADASGDPPQHHRDEEGLPGEKEERSDRANVKGDHEDGRDPDDRLGEGSIVQWSVVSAA